MGWLRVRVRGEEEQRDGRMRGEQEEKREEEIKDAVVKERAERA